MHGLVTVHIVTGVAVCTVTRELISMHSNRVTVYTVQHSNLLINLHMLQNVNVLHADEAEAEAKKNDSGASYLERC